MSRYALEVDGSETDAELASLKSLDPIVVMLNIADGLSRLHASRCGGGQGHLCVVWVWVGGQGHLYVGGDGGQGYLCVDPDCHTDERLSLTLLPLRGCACPCRRVFESIRREGVSSPVIHHIRFPAGVVRDELVIKTGGAPVCLWGGG